MVSDEEFGDNDELRRCSKRMTGYWKQFNGMRSLRRYNAREARQDGHDGQRSEQAARQYVRRVQSDECLQIEQLEEGQRNYRNSNIFDCPGSPKAAMFIICPDQREEHEPEPAAAAAADPRRQVEALDLPWNHKELQVVDRVETDGSSTACWPDLGTRFAVWPK
ncbi:hypothetical protein AXG93_2227s1030 [Marchantia polymorpha subsp. ruderalis]|uniref:Uncharacterized protein n=1 Tax=Marchantia polymorpha subsp. ruderalis TaxID=1480154 RepID=A0A176VZA5_MARPO|nr:hypothetical protein AXG93_2227s1030 [Marchantia polymorpha subsp. ruderalis]